MTELSKVIEVVRKRILSQGQEMHEENTKTALINPVLSALGWEVGNLEDVSQEYRRRSRDKPVDYALLLLRTPKIFVEAKGLNQNLNDRKWINQIMGYAAVGGVKWTVITNGDEYRIYNACVAVHADEKLFRSVRLTDDSTRTEETLSLLSKDRIRDNDIEGLWNAHFVDRQVHTALKKLFAPGPDPALLSLLKKRIRELPPKDIRASLNRVRAQFDFPKPEVSKTPNGPGKPPKPPINVTLKKVIDAGLLKPPLELRVHYKGKNLEAESLQDGSIQFQSKKYKTCSAAATVARSTIVGRRLSTNGWTFWCYKDEDGNSVPLDAARREYMKRKKA